MYEAFLRNVMNYEGDAARLQALIQTLLQKRKISRNG